MTEETQTPVQPAPPPNPAEGQVALNVSDLQATIQALDLAVARGAFRGPEMSQVGQVYDRINTFVESVKAQQDANKTNEAEGTAEGEVKDGS